MVCALAPGDYAQERETNIARKHGHFNAADRRLIRLTAQADLHWQAVPIYDSRRLNRACLDAYRGLLKARTHRRRQDQPQETNACA